MFAIFFCCRTKDNRPAKASSSKYLPLELEALAGFNRQNNMIDVLGLRKIEIVFSHVLGQKLYHYFVFYPKLNNVKTTTRKL